MGNIAIFYSKYLTTNNLRFGTAYLEHPVGARFVLIQ